MRVKRETLTSNLLVLGQRQQSHRSLPHVLVHLLLFVVEHIKVKALTPQVLVQVLVRGDAVRLAVVELGVAAVVDCGGWVVGEVRELVDHIGARLQGSSGLQVSAALDRDVKLIPAAAAGWKRLQATSRVRSERCRCHNSVIFPQMSE